MIFALFSSFITLFSCNIAADSILKAFSI